MITDPRWTALGKSRQNELLNEYRDVNISYDHRWWKGIDAQIREEMAEIGIYVSQLYFSGFWSQGDGAAIEGYVNDWFQVLTYLKDPYAEQRARMANEERWEFRVNSRGFYCHSGTLHAVYDIPEDNCPFDQDEDPLRYHAWRIANPHILTQAGIEELEKQLLALFVSRSDDAYKRLEQEHDDLTSDETIAAYILEHCPEELDEEEEEILAE